MKKVIPFLSLLCIMSMLVSGCGGEFTGKSQGGAASGNAVSGEAVSGKAVSGDAVRPEGTEKQDKKNKSANTSLKSHQFCSANCLYMADYDNNELIQYCVKTNKEKIYDIKGLLGLLLVEKDRIYYTKSLWDGELEEEEDKYRIYSIPIVSDEDGSETPILEKEERLEDIPELSYNNSYPQMDGDSIYYIPYGSEGMVRYDRKEKKGEIVPLEYCTGVQKLKEKTILYSQKDDTNILGVWNIKTDKMIHIPLHETEEDDFESSEVLTEDGLYYSWPSDDDPRWEELKCLDFSTQETRIFVTEQKIKDVLSEKVGMKKNTLKSCSVYLNVVGNRLYLTLSLEWTEGTCWNVQDVILSRELGTEGELQYEEELTECIRKYGKTRRGEPKKFDDYTFGMRAGEMEGIEELCYNAASFAAIEEERAYLNPDTEKFLDGEKYILFDRKTGKSKLIEKDMPEYYEFYYDRLWEEDFDDGF